MPRVRFSPASPGHQRQNRWFAGRTYLELAGQRLGGFAVLHPGRSAGALQAGGVCGRRRIACDPPVGVTQCVPPPPLHHPSDGPPPP